MSTSPSLPTLQTQPRSSTRSFPWARSPPAWPAVPGSHGNSGRRGAPLAPSGNYARHRPGRRRRPPAMPPRDGRGIADAHGDFKHPGHHHHRLRQRDTTGHDHTERPELICPELSPWPRRDRGSAMSKTIPFGSLYGSYQEGMGLYQPPNWPLPGEIRWAQLGSTRDASLVRRSLIVAGRRPASPEVPANWTDRRWTSPCVARRLPPLAPRLAPPHLVSFANEYHHRRVSTGPGRRYQIGFQPAERRGDRAAAHSSDLQRSRLHPNLRTSQLTVCSMCPWVRFCPMDLEVTGALQCP